MFPKASEAGTYAFCLRIQSAQQPALFGEFICFNVELPVRVVSVVADVGGWPDATRGKLVEKAIVVEIDALRMCLAFGHAIQPVDDDFVVADNAQGADMLHVLLQVVW